MSEQYQPVQPIREPIHPGFCRMNAASILGESRDDGSTLIEFALTLPPLLMVVCGVLYFSLAMNNYILLRNATSAGTRAVAISRGQTTDPCQLASSVISGAMPFMRAANISYTYTFNGVSYTGTSCSVTSSTASANLVQGKPVSITTTYPCILTVYGHNYAPGCTLSAQTTELSQ